MFSLKKNECSQANIKRSTCLLLFVWTVLAILAHFQCLPPMQTMWPRDMLSGEGDTCSPWHYDDVIMGAMASQIISFAIVYSTVYSGADQRKHQSSVPLAFVRGIHRWPVNSPHKRPVTRKMFPFDDVIMTLGRNVYVSAPSFPTVSESGGLKAADHKVNNILTWRFSSLKKSSILVHCEG